MKKTQGNPTDAEQTVDLAPTTPEALGGEDTERERSGSSAHETGLIPPQPDTEHSGARDVSPGPTAGQTVSLDDLGFEEATQPPKAGAATLDAPPSGDRGNTLSFSLHSDADDTERTLPPGAEQPERIRPKVAGYEILGILGEGGMGIVFKAKQDRLGRFVALKMIRAGGRAPVRRTWPASRLKRRRSRRSSTRTSCAFSRLVSMAGCRSARLNIFPAAAWPD